MRIGDPISTAGMKLDARSELNAALRRQVAELIGEPAG
jgi:hypothetical protein